MNNYLVPLPRGGHFILQGFGPYIMEGNHDWLLLRPQQTLGAKRLLRPNVGRLDVLVAETLDFVVSFFLIEADLSRSHDLTGPLIRGVKLHLKITERVIGGAAAAIEVDKRHFASPNDGDDRVWAFLTFASDGDLIAGGTDCIDAALILFFQGAAKGVGSLILD